MPENSNKLIHMFVGTTYQVPDFEDQMTAGMSQVGFTVGCAFYWFTQPDREFNFSARLLDTDHNSEIISGQFHLEHIWPARDPLITQLGITRNPVFCNRPEDCTIRLNQFMLYIAPDPDAKVCRNYMCLVENSISQTYHKTINVTEEYHSICTHSCSFSFRLR